MKKFSFILLILFNFSIAKIYLPQEMKEQIPKEQQYLAFINAIMDIVKKAYITKLSEEEITEKILYGLFNELDVNTSYIDEETLELIKEELKGKFGGLGIFIVPYKGFLKVMNCIEGGSGIEHLIPGDVITHIDDKFILGLNTEKVIRMLKGKPGTYVKLKINRVNKKSFEKKFIRKTLNIPNTKTEIYENICYLKISMFHENLAKDIKKILNKIKSNKNIKGMIIDLRFNTGGLLSQTINVLEFFLPKGTKIVSVRSRNSNTTLETVKDPILPNLPIVIIINAFSASASEIFAGAMQVNKRATIVGEISHGKASVQELITISPKTAIKMTIAKYYLIGMKDIQSYGIIPDIEIKTKYSDIINFREKDLEKALKNDDKDLVITKEEENNRLNTLEQEMKITETNNKANSEADKLLDEFIYYKNIPLKQLVEKDIQLSEAFKVLKKKIGGTK